MRAAHVVFEEAPQGAPTYTRCSALDIVRRKAALHGVARIESAHQVVEPGTTISGVADDQIERRPDEAALHVVVGLVVAVYSRCVDRSGARHLRRDQRVAGISVIRPELLCQEIRARLSSLRESGATRERLRVVHRDALAQPQAGRVLRIAITERATSIRVQSNEVPRVKELVRQLDEIRAWILREITARHSNGDGVRVLERSIGAVLEEKSVVRVRRLSENSDRLGDDSLYRVDKLSG